MNDITQYIDVLVQAPVTVTLIWFIYKQFQYNKDTLDNYKEIIQKLIDKK
jgi:hypothetical protein